MYFIYTYLICIHKLIQTAFRYLQTFKLSFYSVKLFCAQTVQCTAVMLSTPKYQ